jgi:hypothetical protein
MSKKYKNNDPEALYREVSAEEFIDIINRTNSDYIPTIYKSKALEIQETVPHMDGGKHSIIILLYDKKSTIKKIISYDDHCHLYGFKDCVRYDVGKNYFIEDLKNINEQEILSKIDRLKLLIPFS